MILNTENNNSDKYMCKVEIKKSHYDIFLKNIYLQLYKSRLLINANYKINILINKFILAWSYRDNEKAYVNRRRIPRRNTCSSY
jgi:hypothetical protein